MGNDTATVGGTAIYDLGDSTGSCTGAIVNGTFKAGVALTSGNTITLEVDVDSIGTYTVSTGTVNGISFSGTGSFTTTGVQNITLTGNGTPTATGATSFTLGNGGCGFSVIVETNGGTSTGTAVYSFNGGTSSCTGASVNGTYTAGTAVSAANTVVLNVIVDSVGTYNISTLTVNGILFSGTGTFTTTGAQSITLVGSGTPAAAGIFNYTFGSTSCSFSVNVATAPITSTDYFFDIVVDGIQYTKVANSTSGYDIYYLSSGLDSLLFASGISTVVNPVPVGMTTLEIDKGLFKSSSSATTDADFKNFFSTGSYPYSEPLSFRGISIIWRDDQNKIWSTDKMPGTQAGSNFTITEVGDYFDGLGTYTVKIKATFNCKVYDDMGNSKTLTNGQYYGPFQNF